MWIYLARHAETVGNLARIVQTPSTPLSELGPKQALALATEYSNKNIAKVMCSDYKRTQDTAAPLLAKMDVDTDLNPMLRERNFGDLRGLAYDDIDTNFFEQDYEPANGETYSQFVERIKEAWKQVVETAQDQPADEHLMVMTHGLVVRCVLTEILKLPESVLNELDVKNTCITQINCRDMTEIPLLRDTSHLDIHSVPTSSNLGAV